ncbi:MAG: CHASE3 domain-containing protein, partial [Saprospiraceae bacterium]
MKQLSKNTSTLLFITLIGLLVVLAFISYKKIKQFNDSVDWVMFTNEVKNKIIDLESNLKDAEVGQRDYLLTEDSIFLQPFIGAELRNRLVFAILDSLIRDNPVQYENLKNLKTLTDQRFLLLNYNLKLLKNNHINSFAHFYLLKGKYKMDEIRKQVVLILQEEDRLLDERTKIKDRTATLTPIFL